MAVADLFPYAKSQYFATLSHTNTNNDNNAMRSQATSVNESVSCRLHDGENI